MSASNSVRNIKERRTQWKVLVGERERKREKKEGSKENERDIWKVNERWIIKKEKKDYNHRIKMGTKITSFIKG